MMTMMTEDDGGWRRMTLFKFRCKLEERLFLIFIILVDSHWFQRRVCKVRADCGLCPLSNPQSDFSDLWPLPHSHTVLECTRTDPDYQISCQCKLFSHHLLMLIIRNSSLLCVSCFVQWNIHHLKNSEMLNAHHRSICLSSKTHLSGALQKKERGPSNCQ